MCLPMFSFYFAWAPWNMHEPSLWMGKIVKLRTNKKNSVLFSFFWLPTPSSAFNFFYSDSSNRFFFFSIHTPDSNSAVWFFLIRLLCCNVLPFSTPTLSLDSGALTVWTFFFTLAPAPHPWLQRTFVLENLVRFLVIRVAKRFDPNKWRQNVFYLQVKGESGPVSLVPVRYSIGLRPSVWLQCHSCTGRLF